METFYVKLSGKCNIPQKLEIGHNYKLSGDCSVTSEQRIDNNDGTFDIVSKLEPITVAVERDNGEVIKAKDPRRNSQKIRNYLFKIYTAEGYIEDFDKVYDTFTHEVMGMTPELLRQTIKRLNQ